MNNSINLEKKELSQSDIQRQVSKGFSCTEEKKNKILFRDLVQMGFNANFIQRSLTKHKIDNLNEAVEMMIKVNGKYSHRFQPRKDDKLCDVCEDVIENHLEFKPTNYTIKDNFKDLSLRYVTSKNLKNVNENSYEQVRVRSMQIENKLNIYNIDYYNYSERDKRSVNDLSEKNRLNSIRERNQFEIASKNVHSDKNDPVFFKKDLEGTLFCGICLGEIDILSKKYKLECEDNFCDDCLLEHIKEEIMNSRVLKLKCPKQGCTVNISEDKIKEIMQDKEMIEKYRKFYKIQLLQSDPNIKFCPITDCDGHAENIQENSEQNECKKLICQYNHEFCSVCNKNWHEGRNCEDVINNELDGWIKQHQLKIRKCENCKAYIEKNMGCNHMTCIHCKYNFCWLCNKPYTPNHYEQRGFCYNKQFWDPDNPALNQLYYGEAVNLFLNQNLQRNPDLLMNNVLGNGNIMRLNLWNGNFIYQLFYMFSFASHSLSRSSSFFKDVFYYFLFFISHLVGNLFVVIAIYKNTIYFRKYLSDRKTVIFLYYLSSMCMWIYSYLAFIGSSVLFLTFGVINSAIINFFRLSPEEIQERMNAALALENPQINPAVELEPINPIVNIQPLVNIQPINLIENNEPRIEGIIVQPNNEIREDPNNNNINNNQNNNEGNRNNPSLNNTSQINVNQPNEHNKIIDHNSQPYQIIPLERSREKTIKIESKVIQEENENNENKINIAREVPNLNLNFNNISNILPLENESPAKSESPYNIEINILRKQNTQNLSHYTVSQNSILNNNNIILSIKSDPKNENEIKSKNYYSLEIKAGNNLFNNDENKDKMTEFEINQEEFNLKEMKDVTFINYKASRMSSIEMNNQINQINQNV